MGRFYSKLKEPPLVELCERYGKPMPKLRTLQKIARNFPYRFKREDFAAARGINGGPFMDAMAMAIQAYLGLDPYGTEVLEHTSEIPAHLLETPDLFHQGWTGIVSTLGKGFRIDQRSYLKTEEQVLRAADDVAIALGWQLETEEFPDSDRMDKEYLRRKGKDNFPCGTEYPSLLLKWWKCNPNIVLSAYTPRNRVGATSLLPFTKQAYEKLRRGEIGGNDIGAEHILSKSPYFFLEAGSDRPLIKEDPATKTKSVVACLLAQLAIGVPPGSERKLRGLSFAACKTGEKRLAKCGFELLPVKLRGTSLSLMEFDSSGIDGIKMAAGIKMARLMLDQPKQH